MKYLKMLGLTAVAAAALMAFVGASTASATVICSTGVNPCPAGQRWPVPAVIKLTLKKGTSAKLVSTENETLDTCTGSTVEGNVTNGGSSTTTVTGEETTLDWSGCTFTTNTTLLGKLEAHATTGGNGTLTADGETKVTINTVLFGSCVYGVTAGTALGSLTGGGNESATFVANAVAKRLSGSAAVCPETSRWTAEYVYTGTTQIWLVPS